MNIYNINTSIATDVGIEESILISILFDPTNKLVYKDISIETSTQDLIIGITEKSISEQLNFWTPKQVSRIISNLEKHGVIKSIQKDSLNRMKFYKLIYKY